MTDINLSALCDAEHKRWRHVYRYGQWGVATDRHSVALALMGDSSLNDVPSLMLPTLDHALSAATGPPDFEAPYSALAGAPPICESCQGKEEPLCVECGGFGEVACCECGQDVECSTCGGAGGDSCEVCSGEPLKLPRGIPGTDVVIDAALLFKLLSVCESDDSVKMWVGPGQLSMVLVRWGEVRAAIMPMRSEPKGVLGEQP